MNIQLVSPLIQNELGEILLAQYDIPESDETIHELPAILLPAEQHKYNYVKHGMADHFGLDIMPGRIIGVLSLSEKTGFNAMCHLVRARLRKELHAPVNERWRYVNLRALGIGRIGLGAYADILRVQLQNEELYI